MNEPSHPGIKTPKGLFLTRFYSYRLWLNRLNPFTTGVMIIFFFWQLNFSFPETTRETPHTSHIYIYKWYWPKLLEERHIYKISNNIPKPLQQRNPIAANEKLLFLSRCHSMFASKYTPKNRRTTRKKIKQTFPWSGMSFSCAKFKSKNKFVTRGSPSTLTKLKFKPDIRQLPFHSTTWRFFSKCLVTRILLIGWPQLKKPKCK